MGAQSWSAGVLHCASEEPGVLAVLVAGRASDGPEVVGLRSRGGNVGARHTGSWCGHQWGIAVLLACASALRRCLYRGLHPVRESYRCCFVQQNGGQNVTSNVAGTVFRSGAASCRLATCVCRAGSAGSHCMQCLATWHWIVQVCMWFIGCSRHQAMLHGLYVLPTLPARIAARLLQLGRNGSLYVAHSCSAQACSTQPQ